MLEAAWITTMEASAPEFIRELQLRMVKVGFFRGAQSMMEILRMAAQEEDDNISQAVVARLAKEIERFFADVHRIAQEAVAKNQQNQPVRH
jgi:hypothetical protein